MWSHLMGGEGMEDGEEGGMEDGEEGGKEH